jgi:hypothetical protein
MKKFFLIIVVLFVASVNAFAAEVTLKGLTKSSPLKQGFISHLYDEKSGKLYLKVNNIGEEFLYQSSLPQGLGSNDIGLDRGQLSDIRLVSFRRVGNRLLLEQQNTNYRAVSDNLPESESVKQAFASAILFGFDITDSDDSWVLVDASQFILQDSHGVVNKLAQRKQGNFRLDKSRSAIYLPRTKSFPDNTELEASVTFTSNKPGAFVRQAAIDPNIISLRIHHSFIRLPKPGYKPRAFHPQGGFWKFDYQDYAQPINQPITQRFIGRHRLAKKDPTAAFSEAVEPIIYYLDPGAPEPVKTALINGGLWWNQAFESIGYKDAFQIKILPEGADPLDVRYNVIQWVHRATRGWSYGFGVTDPRNGEIIKGHVTLGSLRVRQDYLIAQGMLSRFDHEPLTSDVNGQAVDQELMDLALARIRQLSAHEIGHTIGLAHNFAASSFNRASVMDYPHPLFELEKQADSKQPEKQKLTAINAYAENIGEWDKATIAYGYQTFTDKSEKQGLADILQSNQDKGYIFISDPDARKKGDAQVKASLWDNGSNAIDELERMVQLRKVALSNFGDASLNYGRPYSDLQEILIPVYYFHRYQTEAAAKWVGGLNYQYQQKQLLNHPMSSQFASAKEQKRAVEVMLETLQPKFLKISNELQRRILPRAYGHKDSRESLKRQTGVLFDPNALARGSIQHTYSLLLEPTRLARLEIQSASESSHMNIRELTSLISNGIMNKEFKGINRLNHQSSIELLISNYLNLLHHEGVSTLVKTEVFSGLQLLKEQLAKKMTRTRSSSSYYSFYQYQLARLKTLEVKQLKANQLIVLPKMPPGSPI